jgi:hypothetical protein
MCHFSFDLRAQRLLPSLGALQVRSQLKILPIKKRTTRTMQVARTDRAVVDVPRLVPLETTGVSCLSQLCLFVICLRHGRFFNFVVVVGTAETTLYSSYR